MTVKEYLTEYLKSDKEYLKLALPKYDLVQSNKSSISEEAQLAIYRKGIASLLFDHNLEKMKYYFGAAGFFLELMNNYDHFYTAPRLPMMTLFLSDNSQYINNWVAHDFIPLSRDTNTMIIEGPMVVISYLLRKDKANAEKSYNQWMQSEEYKKDKWAFNVMDQFIKGLSDGDATEIKIGIEKLLSKKQISFYRREIGEWESVFSTWANFCGKVAFMLGYEINIDHPAYHIDVVKVNPLIKYPSLEDIRNEFK